MVERSSNGNRAENSAASAAVSPPDELSIAQYLLCHCVEVVVSPFTPSIPIIYLSFVKPFFPPIHFLALFKVERSFQCTPAAIRPSILLYHITGTLLRDRVRQFSRWLFWNSAAWNSWRILLFLYRLLVRSVSYILTVHVRYKKKKKNGP